MLEKPIAEEPDRGIPQAISSIKGQKRPKSANQSRQSRQCADAAEQRCIVAPNRFGLKMQNPASASQRGFTI